MKSTTDKKDDDDKVDHVVTIKSDTSKTIEFKNLSLAPNQYIKFGNDAKVNLTSGQLNIVLDGTSKNVNINVNDTSNIQLSIKNMDDCTVKIETQGSERSNVTITSNSEVYDHLTFDVTENAELIEIESINLHESGSISSKVPVSDTNIEAQPQTVGSLNNVVVSETFTISQSSVLELNNCNLSNAALNLNLHTYSSSSYENPMLNGTFGDPPAKISFNKENDNTSPDDNQELLLFQGTFKSSCDDWKNKIDYNEIDFNDGVCKDIDNLVILQEQKALKVLYNPKLSNGQNDNKLSGGQIAGIVVGCVSGVAIIVVVVIIIIIIKKKNNQESSMESGNGNKDDL